MLSCKAPAGGPDAGNPAAGCRSRATQQMSIRSLFLLINTFNYALNYRFGTLPFLIGSRMKYFLFVLLAASFLHAAPGEEQIVINNRILTTVNGKTLSVLDVVKQMDVFLNQYYPQYLESEPARMQFYTTQWKTTLQRMIDQELMVADAESREVKATDAEVREEIQNRYGPNVMGSLDKLGINYEEAKKMIHQELVVQKIQWLRVTSKVLSKVTTEVLKNAFKDYLAKNPPKEIWNYQFLTLRYDNVDTAMSIAQQVEALQETSGNVLSVAADLLKQKLPEAEWTHLSLSPDLQSEDKELSEAHRDVLSKMSGAGWSEPTIQQSRDGSQVVRIFNLKSHTKQEAPLFETMANGLKQEILNQYADKEMEVYLARLHQRFNYNPSSLDIPSQFEPFSF